MVILFSERKSKTEREIIKILCGYGAGYISDNPITGGACTFTLESEYKKPI